MDESILCWKRRTLVTYWLSLLLILLSLQVLSELSHTVKCHIFWSFFFQLSSMLAFFKVLPGVLISLIFIRLNIKVKHLFYDLSENLAALLIVQLSIIEDICLLGNLLCDKNINLAIIFFLVSIFLLLYVRNSNAVLYF